MKQSMRVRLVSLIALLMAVTMVVAAGASVEPRSLSANLTGAEEVPPVNTDARGEANYTIRGTMVDYRLVVHDISNVVAAHIHCGAFGTNGGVVQFLYGTAPAGGGPEEGLLSRGTFDASTLTCSGMPLIDAMKAELTYTNVHTSDGVADNDGNRSPGDVPSGEIRGQIIPRT